MTIEIAVPGLALGIDVDAHAHAAATAARRQSGAQRQQPREPVLASNHLGVTGELRARGDLMEVA
jgi:hypothetical protein